MGMVIPLNKQVSVDTHTVVSQQCPLCVKDYSGFCNPSQLFIIGNFDQKSVFGREFN